MTTTRDAGMLFAMAAAICVSNEFRNVSRVADPTPPNVDDGSKTRSVASA